MRRLWRVRWTAFWRGVSIREIRAISKAYRDLRRSEADR